jgi:hypothetical protein
MADAGDYTVVVSNIAGTTTSPAATLGPVGLVALYTFREGSGNVVRDVSNLGDPLDLNISNPANVRWLAGGGLSLEGAALISSSVPAAKVIQATRASHELTVEVWAKPANTTQAGPARFVSLSSDISNRNFTLGQDAANYQFRFRTTATDANGGPNYITAVGAASTELTHIAYTRNSEGQSWLYVNGVEAAQMPLGGAPDNWVANYHLGLGAELDGQRSWLGELHRVAIHSKALSASEISASYQAGPKAPGPTPTGPVTLTNVGRVGAAFQFSFTSVSGRSYVVEYKDALTPGSWTQLRVVNGDGSAQNVSADITGNTRFFRVRTE